MQRETIHRHRSERLLDRFLLSSHFESKTNLKPKRLPLLVIQQESQDVTQSEQVKRQKIEDEDKSRLREKYKSLDTEAALTKILTHLRGKKQHKCLELLKKIIFEQFDLIRPHVLFNSFVYFVNSDCEDLKYLEEIYFHMLQIADSGEFNTAQITILDVYYIRAVVCAQLNDSINSFKLGQVADTLIEILENEVDEFEESEAEEENLSVLNVKLEHLDREIPSQQLLQIVESLKQKLVFDALVRCGKKFMSKDWAKSILQLTIRRAFQLSSRFSLEQQDVLADLLKEMKKSSTSAQLRQIKQEKVDLKIRQNPLESAVGFTDGRQEKFMLSDATDKWAGKQQD